MTSHLEERTRHWGNLLFDHLRTPWAIPLCLTWWEDRAMAATMADPDLKVQLFRFVDALPTLSTAHDIRRHLVEYLRETPGKRCLSWLAGWIPTWGPAGTMVTAATRWAASRMARRFIVGSTRQQTLNSVREMRRNGFAATLDILGEATLTEDEAEQSLAEYLALVNETGKALADVPFNSLLDSDGTVPLPRGNVSIKVSALCAVFDPADPDGTARSVLPRLRQILAQARDSGVFIHFDMEQYASRNLLLHLFERLMEEPEFRQGPEVGIAIQAYLHETPADLEQLLDWAKTRGRPITVRLVKGAYWDYETIHSRQMGWPVPVFEFKSQTDRQYEDLAEFLVTHRQWLRPAFGSHNVRSLARVLAIAESAGLPPEAIEFQSLFGMGEPIQNALKTLGRRVRVYAPYGDLLPGMAYLVRRLLENTANDSFLRQSFTEHRDRQWLLSDPREKCTMATGTGSIRASAPNGTPAGAPIPLADFSQAETRHSFQVALDSVRGQLGVKAAAFAGGRPLTTPHPLPSFNPSIRRQLVGEAALCDRAESALAVESCGQFQLHYGSFPAQQRARWLRHAADIMLNRRFELASWMVFEAGKSWREADADVAEAIDFCCYYADQAEFLNRPHDRAVPGESNITIRQGRGVAAVIAPWNFPLAILCGMTSAALAAGCATVMKPAEQTPIVGWLLHGIFLEAGVPPEALALVFGPGETVGDTLVTHPGTSVIAFTGSLQTGALINERAAGLAPGQKHFKRVLAEMGGKNAVIIDDDADLDESIRSVLAASFGYQGQKCSACSRLLVPHNMHDQLAHRLAEAARTLTIGNAEDPTFSMGPVIDDEARVRIEKVIDAGRSRGTDLLNLTAGSLTETGSFVAPAIFTGLGENDSLVTDEIFGPVLVVLPYRDFNDAIRIANNTPFALTAGLHSRSPARIAQFSQEVRAGNLYINRKITGAVVDRQPFGGYGFSGIGAKAGGPDYLPQFMIARTVTENTMRRGFSPDTVVGPTIRGTVE